jgi:hypothetical protein
LSEINELPRCFVIQPFDGGTYDRRYTETIKPALEKSGVLPVRADDILGVNPVIEKIEQAIAASPICIAEVSVDNPNVWLELGYALALNRPTVILCEKTVRPRLPFDVQHKSIIFYRTDSRSGFDELEKNIIRLVKHELLVEKKIQKAHVLKPSEVENVDLKEHEVAILTTIFSFYISMDGGVESWTLENKIRDMGFKDIALALGISALIESGFISESVENVSDGSNFHEAKIYKAEPPGIAWVRQNQDLLEIREVKVQAKRQVPQQDFDDGIPF